MTKKQQLPNSATLANPWKHISRALLHLWNYRLIVIGVACAALYLAFMFFGFERILFFDEHEYLSIAKNLISSGIYAYEPGVPTASRPPGYLLFVTPIVALGMGKPGIVFAQTLLWGASIYVSGLISCRLRGPTAGALAILFAILYPLCSFVTLTVYPQILTAFLMLLIIWILLKEGSEKLISAQTAILIGIIVGFTILVSPIFVPLFIGMLLLLPFISSTTFSFRNFRPSIIAVLVSCGLIAPWIARNWVVMGAPAISTIVGFNLLYGNSENAAPELGTTADIKKYAEAVRGMNEVSDRSCVP